MDSEEGDISATKVVSTSESTQASDSTAEQASHVVGPAAPEGSGKHGISGDFDPKHALDAFDWEALERQLYARQREFAHKERASFEEFEAWMQVFEAWAMTGTEHEDDRARKRLRTRIEHVKGSERNLEEKREHYVKVIEAFSSALSMLS